MSQIVFQKDWFAVLRSRSQFLIYYLTADSFATKLGLMAHHHKVDCLVKRLDHSSVIKVKVTEKVQYSSKCSSG